MCVFVCMCAYVHMHVCLYGWMDGCVCVCVYVCMCASVCRHMHAQCREHTSAQDAGLLGGSKPSTPGQRASAIAWDTSVTPARVTIVTILPAFSPSAPLAPQHHTSACVRTHGAPPPFANTHMNLLTYRHTLSLAHTHREHVRSQATTRLRQRAILARSPVLRRPGPASGRARCRPHPACMYTYARVCIDAEMQTDRRIDRPIDT